MKFDAFLTVYATTLRAKFIFKLSDSVSPRHILHIDCKEIRDMAF